jgi:hypothetical protein
VLIRTANGRSERERTASCSYIHQAKHLARSRIHCEFVQLSVPYVSDTVSQPLECTAIEQGKGRGEVR